MQDLQREWRERLTKARATAMLLRLADSLFVTPVVTIPHVQHGQSSLPMPFLVMLVFWLTIIFASFCLLSPRNATVIAVLLICALLAAGALFLVLELDTSTRG